MKQSKRKSAIEAGTNTLSAFCVSWVVQAFVIPVVFESVQTDVSDAFLITAIYTALSFARNYVIRRFFA